jgi:DNA-binding transcriptional LysR family regulator
MDWDKLKTFHFAAEVLSLSAAADKLGLSQSAVSRQIAALEAQLGTPLFQRHARGLVVTEFGATLQAATRQMAAQAALMESTLRDMSARPSGRLRVTAPVALGSFWLIPRLPQFYADQPLMQLDLMLDDREYDLLTLEAECAIRLWEARHADLVQRKLMDVTVSLYASPAYLEAHGAPSTVADLDKHRIIAFAGANLNSPMKDVSWVSFVGRDTVDPRPAALTLSTVPSLVTATEAGLGIASLPDYMARGVPGLVPVLPELEGPSFEVYFIFPVDLRKSNRIMAFRDFLLSQTGRSR